MSIEKEIEFKQLLDAHQYQKIKNTYFQNQDPFSQKNYYIDTPDMQISKHQMALRIREKGNSNFELTLKVPDSVGLTEYNTPISSLPSASVNLSYKLLSQEILTVLNKKTIDVHQLGILGALETHRLEKQLPSGLLVLDHSLYLDTEDYELEFEVNTYQQGLLAFQDILEQFEIQHQPPLNKVQRFFERKHFLKSQTE
ncbi:CYTH domain-containing protein [Staphylococcus felis]|uniref:CYTH domain-containing protein n=1 Tax=Staphylococcus felis TaxID=46127 RepID=UPI0024815A78|nr:CYTH domain-containing protein [Staphylococcus felis]MDQ7193327.1 CYTH domain-containing protein [Staphylococcus felis]